MRILHVGWGFSPWRPGGLIAYAEDLMAAQAAAGHEVSYFLSGRHYHVAGPRLKRWRRGGVRMYEVINPPVVAGMEAGTRDPARELSEPRTEAAFARVLAELRPDVVHVQELVGLPSALIDVAAAAGVPTLMTLQDYFPLCATLRLFDADGRICERLEVGADCAARNAAAPPDAGHLLEETVDFELDRLRHPRGLRPHDAGPLLGGLLGWALRQRRRGRPAPEPGTPAAAPEQYQRRRELNVERLGRVDRLIAQSPRVAEIYRARGVPGERMATLPFTLDHVARLRPRRIESPPAPVVFATLNGCASPSKGSRVVAGALRALRDAGLEGSFRLRVLGHVDPGVADELGSYAGVELTGLYERKQLDGLLDDVDVGIMPSVWEEAFGYTGTELLAKGVPLIANPLGGIVEYAREGQTAWLNRSCSAAGLAERMAELVAEPAQIVRMHERLMAVRDDVVIPMKRHSGELMRHYQAITRR